MSAEKLKDATKQELLKTYKRCVAENALNLQDWGRQLNELEAEILRRMALCKCGHAESEHGEGRHTMDECYSCGCAHFREETTHD